MCLLSEISPDCLIDSLNIFSLSSSLVSLEWDGNALSVYGERGGLRESRPGVSVTDGLEEEIDWDDLVWQDGGTVACELQFLFGEPIVWWQLWLWWLWSNSEECVVWEGKAEMWKEDVGWKHWIE